MKADNVKLGLKIIYEGNEANLDIHSYNGTLTANTVTKFGSIAAPAGHTILAVFLQPIGNVASVINLYVDNAWNVYGYSNGYAGGLTYFCAIVYK